MLLHSMIAGRRTALGGLGLLVACVACAGGDDGASAVHGPPGGVLEVDAGEMSGPGGSGATGAGGAGYGGAGGAGATGATGAVGNSGGSGNLGGGGGAEPTVRVGDTCETAADCPNGMHCREDSVDYLAHEQCTAPCSTAAECASLGSDTMCIQAGICVRTCSLDSDCPPLTQCNSSGWCERGGPGSGIPICDGIATPCSSLSDYQCTSALGCSLEGDCSGYPPSCYSQSTNYLCIRVDGCYWSTYYDNCSGSPRSCRLYSGQYTCNGQPGCRWDESCEGTPLDCETVGLSGCDTQPGCQVVYQ
jgi:hypothetical protein